MFMQLLKTTDDTKVLGTHEMSRIGLVYFRLFNVCKRIIMETKERNCKECGEVLKGRIDQKFCSDQCRTSYNNHLNRDVNCQIRQVNYILRKNRRILARLNPEDKCKISREDLANLGFDFRYHTNTYTNKKGQTYYFCYEQGYLRLNDSSFFLVKDLISKS